jgi:hypothetical protein
MCCVEGDAGAPLTAEEIKAIEESMTAIEPFIPQKHLSVIKKEGFYYKDEDGEYCTNLIDGQQCVFVYFEEDSSGGNPIAKCAIEKAFEQGLCSFQKPVSCHLYPIRITDYDGFSTLNFHYWQEVCINSLNDNGLPLYKMLKTPLLRRFGNDWYQELVAVCEASQN